LRPILEDFSVGVIFPARISKFCQRQKVLVNFSLEGKPHYLVPDLTEEEVLALGYVRNNSARHSCGSALSGPLMLWQSRRSSIEQKNRKNPHASRAARVE